MTYHNVEFGFLEKAPSLFPFLATCEPVTRKRSPFSERSHKEDQKKSEEEDEFIPLLTSQALFLLREMLTALLFSFFKLLFTHLVPSYIPAKIPLFLRPQSFAHKSCFKVRAQATFSYGNCMNYDPASSASISRLSISRSRAEKAEECAVPRITHCQRGGERARAKLREPNAFCFPAQRISPFVTSLLTLGNFPITGRLCCLKRRLP